MRRSRVRTRGGDYDRIHATFASAVEMADRAIVDAETIERRADALGGQAVLAEALLAAIEATARGVLRLAPTDGPVIDLADLAEEDVEPWSVANDELAMELAGLIAHLLADHRTFLILEMDEPRSRYVQLLTYDRGLFIETVSDRFLDPDDQLTDAESAALTELGFHPPASGGADGPPNWWIELDEAGDVHQVAALLVRTLVEVHGLVSSADLVVKTATTTGPFASHRERG